MMQLLKNVIKDLDSLCFPALPFLSSMVYSHGTGIIHLPGRKMREEKKQWMGPSVLPEKIFPGSPSQANFHGRRV